MLKKRFGMTETLLAGGILSLALPQTSAQPILPADGGHASALTVRISPDAPERLYATGEIATFTVEVLKDGRPATSGSAEVWIAPEGGPANVSRHHYDLAKQNPFRVEGRSDEACFLLCQVWASDGGPEAYAEEQVWYRAPPNSQALTLDIRPNRSEGLYRCDEEARFEVRVLKDGKPVETGGRLELQLQLAGRPPALVSQTFTFPLAENAVASISGTLHDPDFLYCRAQWIPPEGQGKALGNWLSVGFEPERIQAYTRSPSDLETFWKKILAQARALPTEVELEPLDAFSNSRATFFRFSINTLRGQRVHGFLGLPTGPGPFPVVAFFPGAGPGTGRPIDMGLTARGVLTLMLNVHTHPVAEDPVAAKAQVDAYVARHQVASYIDVGIAAPETFHFHGVLAGFCRAMDYVCARDGWWDGQHLVFDGASQGGFLTLVMSALYADKATRSLAGVPYLCDYPRTHPDASPKTLRTMAYYDPANLAAWIRCPVGVSVAFADSSCPPASVFSAYNAVTVHQKNLRIEPRDAHGTTPERQAYERPILLQSLGLN